MELIRHVNVLERGLADLAHFSNEGNNLGNQIQSASGWGPHSVQVSEQVIAEMGPIDHRVDQMEEVVEQLSIRNLNYTYKRGKMKPLFLLGEFEDDNFRHPTLDEDSFEEEKFDVEDDPLAVAKHDYASEDRSIKEYSVKLNKRRRRANRNQKSSTAPPKSASSGKPKKTVVASPPTSSKAGPAAGKKPTKSKPKKSDTLARR